MLVYRSDGDGYYTDSRSVVLTNMIMWHNLQSKLDIVKDHKGNLSVEWSTKPTYYDIEIINKAWVFLCECHVEHYFNGNLIHEYGG